MIGLDIVYCVTAGKSMQFLYKHTCHGWRQGTCAPFGLSAWIVVFAAIQMILSMVNSASCCQWVSYSPHHQHQWLLPSFICLCVRLGSYLQAQAVHADSGHAQSTCQ